MEKQEDRKNNKKKKRNKNLEESLRRASSLDAIRKNGAFFVKLILQKQRSDETRCGWFTDMTFATSTTPKSIFMLVEAGTIL